MLNGFNVHEPQVCHRCRDKAVAINLIRLVDRQADCTPYIWDNALRRPSVDRYDADGFTIIAFGTWR